MGLLVGVRYGATGCAGFVHRDIDSLANHIEIADDD